MRAALALVLALTILPGCHIYFGGDDTGDDTVCAGAGDGAAEPYYEPYEIINPDTLACEDWGWSGGGGCNDACGPCPAAEADAVPLPSWGLCESQCRILDEGTCLAEPGCRATYDWGCYTGDGPCTAEVAFTGCFPLDMTGPLEGACGGLGSWACSAHDNCIALHDFSGAADSWSTFIECADEVPTCGAQTTEEACLGAGEPCIPAYTGTDCTCDPQGVCDCEVWTYRECVENR